jgi:hypothetical protein
MVTQFASRRARRIRAACLLATGSLLCGLAAAPPALAAASHPATAMNPQTGAASRTYQTERQAVAQARRTGKPVPVTALTTPTSMTTANPDGTLAVTESGGPVRTRVNGTWRDLDASLIRNPDGTWSPAVSANPLALSGGGTGPLATMTYGGYSLSLTAPMRLPAPVISGAAATYTGIEPGIDLIVTAKASGGYGEVLRINNRAAAASPALASLTFTTRTRGLSVTRAGNGGLTARNARGLAIFAAPAPRMWDSTVSAQVQRAMASGGTARADTAGFPVKSTAATPAVGARSAPVGASVTGSRLTLVPDHGLLTRADATFPEYIDPDWRPAGNPASHWAYITSAFPTTPNYDTEADGSNYLQVGEEPGCDPHSCNADTGYKSYAFYQIPVPAQIKGAHIYKATAYFPAVWSDSCTPSPIDLYLTSKAISGSTTWDNPPGWGAKLDSDNTAYGWSSAGFGGPSDCATTADQVNFNIYSTISNDAGLAGAIPPLNFGLQAESAGVDGWKQFATPHTTVQGNATITILYAFTPTTPVLSTSATGTSCNGSKSVGDGNVTLQATTTDKDNFTPSIQYTAYASGVTSHTFATNLSSPGATSGSNGTYSGTAQLLEHDLKTALNTYGANQSVKITWTATAKITLTDPSTHAPTTLSSPTASCSFIFTTAQPGVPDLWNDNNGQPSTTDDCGGNAYVIGQPVTFWATPDTTVTPLPDSYIYQLNGGNPVTVGVISTTASPDTGKISVTPTRMTNILTVTAVSGGVNNGQPATCIIGANPPATAAADQDLTGDGVPDLLSVGTGTTGIASGLWLASGQGSGGQFDGTVASTATDVAPYGAQGIDTAGNGIALAPNPAGWDGMKAITGQFLGPGFNAIEAYYPGSAKPGIYVIPAQGDGSAATSVAASQGNNLQGALDITPFTDCSYNTAATPDYPLQLANAYDLSANTSGGIPDQIGIYTDSTGNSLSPFGGQSGFLAYFQADSENSFDSSNGNIVPYILQNPAPSGTNWSDWDITTASAPGGGATMFLHNHSSGALYLWNLTGFIAGDTTPPACSADGTAWIPPAAQLTGSPVAMTVPPAWPAGTLATLQATTINGSPGLITVTSSGAVQSWTVSGSNVSAAASTQQLATTDHSYPFTDNTGTTVTDYHGAAATDPERDLTFHLGTADSVAWNTGSMFSPDVTLNEPTSNGTATSGGYLTASAADFSPGSTAGFTISAWVNPNALGGTVFSQNGSSNSTVKVGSTTSGQWTVSMNTAGSSYDTVSGGSAKVGLWTQLTLTYDGYLNGSTSGQDGMLRLYANGTEVASLDDTSPPTTVGAFLIGASQSGGVIGSNLNGEVADVQVWDTLAMPAQPTTPASVFVPMNPPVRILDTRPGSGIGSITGPLGAGATNSVPIARTTPSAGVTIPAAVTAVALSITVTGQTQGGYVTVYANGEPRPATSTLNFAASGNLSNNAIIPVGPDGQIAIYNHGTGTDQVLLDLTGYFTTPDAAAAAHVTGSTYTPLQDPTRLFYTGNGTGSSFYSGTGTNGATTSQVGPGAALTVTIAGNTTNGMTLPASGITAVALNIGVIAPGGDNGWIAAFPQGMPTTNLKESNVSFTGGPTFASTVVVTLNSSNEKISLYNGSAQPVTIVGDLSGYFTSATTGQYYHSLDAARILDTRQTSTALGPNGSQAIPAPAGIIAHNPTLVLNITAVAPTASGYLRAYPAQDSSTGTSVLIFAAAATIADLGLIYTANTNSFIIGNGSAGTVDYLLDINGYFQ